MTGAKELFFLCLQQWELETGKSFAINNSIPFSILSNILASLAFYIYAPKYKTVKHHTLFQYEVETCKRKVCYFFQCETRVFSQFYFLCPIKHHGPLSILYSVKKSKPEMK